MTHLQLERQDEDALFDYINGENDALVLDNPALNNYYYLMSWHDVKASLERGELTERLENINNNLINEEIDEIEIF